MVRVTLAYRDTLTWGGIRVDIRGLSRDGHSYSGIRGYSDMEGEGGHPWTIRGWSQLLSAKYKATVSSMDGSGLSGTVNAIGTCILAT